ncbi:hypothetical protein ACLB2K_032566 [Fragaria x ananassa]
MLVHSQNTWSCREYDTTTWSPEIISGKVAPATFHRYPKSEDDPNDPDTQIEKELFQFGDTSLLQATNVASISHPDPVTALKISFQEQPVKEKAEAEAYRVHITELKKEQLLLRATLDNRNVYNDSLDRAAWVTSTPNPTTTSLFPNQGHGSSVIPGGPNQIICVTYPLTNPSFPLSAPQPFALTNDPSPLLNQPDSYAPHVPNPTSASPT